VEAAVLHINDPIELAKAALAERCRNNPQYSLRAFARATGISHTVLSLVFSGKRKFSRNAVRKLSDFLELDPEQAERLEAGVRRKVDPPKDYEDLSLETFQIISDSHHFAMLSTLELPHAKWDAKWLAKNLSISPVQAKLAMDRLQRLGLVAEENGRWRQTGKPLMVDNARSTSATRAYNRQLLDKAKAAIDNTSFDAREMGSTTFAMDARQIPYAKQRIREFRRQLCAELEAMGSPSAVYHLTVQIFPVTPVPTPETEQ
jgi:hypothetical protein